MKKALTLILAIILVPMLYSSATTINQEKLSDLSDEECVAFLESHGITIPESYSEDMSWTPFIRFVIKQVEADPDMEFVFGYSVALDFAYKIKDAVNEYYGTDQNGVCMLLDTGEETVIQDNVVYIEWSNAYSTYNCYSFAIEYYEIDVDRMNPGVIDWVKNENPVETHSYNWYANAPTVAGWIQDDLESLGYAVTEPTTVMPATVVSDHTHLICVRIDTDGELYYGFRDFHLMRLDEDGYWYHKPGKTSPLKYKYAPSNERIWVTEYYDGKNEERLEWWTYDSDIYFIEYTTPHVYTYRTCGGDKHINTCTICGGTTGSAMACVFVNDKCKICGYIKIESGGLRTPIVPVEDVAA